MSLIRKIVACLAICSMLLFCGGCSVLSSLTALLPSNRETPPDPDAYKVEFQDNWLYNELDSKLQACYGSIYTALTDGFDEDAEVKIGDDVALGLSALMPHALTKESDYQRLHTAFFYDNPQFFYLYNYYGLEGYEQDGISYYNRMSFHYMMDAAERKAAKEKLDLAVNTILNGRPTTTDEYETELYLHDKLVAGCTYDTAATQAEYKESPNAYTAYGALVNGKAVCEGYTRAMQLLFKNTDIRGTLVAGQSRKTDEQHIWNLVSINGNTYHLDATWNDGSDLPMHNYFNVTTDQIKLTHSIADGQQGIVQCDAIKDNFFHRNSLYINTYSRRQIAQVIAERIKQGDTFIQLQFDADKYNNALLFLKSRTAAEEHIQPYLAGSNHTLWQYVLYSEPDERILSIRKK